MGEKDNKRGFSGLSDLTSDTRHAPQVQPRSRDSEPQKTVFSLLELTKWPTLSSPWSSADAGETGIWGDFFPTFQNEAKDHS